MKVEYLGPNRSIVHRGPSGNEYLFFIGQPLEVTNEEDLNHYKSVGGFAVGDREIEETRIEREREPEIDTKKELIKKIKSTKIKET